MISFGVEYNKYKRSGFSQVYEDYITGADPAVSGSDQIVGITQKNLGELDEGEILVPYIPLIMSDVVPND